MGVGGELARGGLGVAEGPSCSLGFSFARLPVCRPPVGDSPIKCGSASRGVEKSSRRRGLVLGVAGTGRVLFCRQQP